ncbi:hypothetical protein PENTCL1PPCAC_15175, partial [Pristionchus entomophagus]
QVLFQTFSISVVFAAAQRVPSTCAATLCTVGSECKESNGVVRCVAPGGSNNAIKCSKPFEEWKNCATCEPTCDNRKPMCAKMCQLARCQCRLGFF